MKTKISYSRGPVSIAVLAMFLALSSQISTCLAQGTAFTYQGQLHAERSPANGFYDLTFSLYDAATNGDQVGLTVTNRTTPISNGLFTVALDFGADVFTGADRWMEIGVRTNGSGSFATLAPREEITAAPYAIYTANAGIASTVADSTVSAAQLNTPEAPLSGQVLSWNGSTLVWSNASGGGGGSGWSLTGNSGTSPTGGNFLGTTDYSPLELRVDGARALRLEPNGNVIAGYSSNIISGSSFSAIAGGGDFGHGNSISSTSFGHDDCFIGGGFANSVDGIAAVIAGGEFNAIGGVQGYGSFVGGGVANTNLGNYSVIAGGESNLISSRYVSDSVIGGGWQNAITGDNNRNSTISGGSKNIIYGDANDLDNYGHSAIGGGYGNIITNSSYSAISGGLVNLVSGDDDSIAGGDDNVVKAEDSVIGGGELNAITNTGWAAISGGKGNAGAGHYCAIPGGLDNYALGDYSFAAGQRAKALFQGDFVWADSQSADFNATTSDQVSFRCQGGVRFTSGGITANQTVTWAPGSGSWSFTSDRNTKDRFAPVDTGRVLEKVSRLQLSEWSYKGYAQRHIGPMAQDFHAEFPLNDNDKALNDTDLHGVELAAIQGLNQKIEQKDALVKNEASTIRRQSAELAELKMRLDRLEKLMGDLDSRRNGGER